MDIFMMILIIVLSIILLVVSLYILAYYCHPEDKGFNSSCASMFSKIAVIIGMTLAWAQVLMLPLDVANTRGMGGGIRMDLFWIIIYISIAVFVFVINPGLSYWYESDPDWSTWEKIKYSFVYLFVTLIVVLVLLIVLFGFLSTAEVPIKTINCPIINIQIQTDPVKLSNCLRNDTILNIDVSLPIFAIGVLSFVSWFNLVIYGGIGLSALPLDLIYDFVTRPKKIPANQIEMAKTKLANDADLLYDLGKNAQDLENDGVKKKPFYNKEKRKYNEIMKKLNAGVLMLDKKVNTIKIQTELNDSWVLQYYIGLFLGIIFIFITLAWLIHILLYFIINIDGQPIYPFLNNLLVQLEESNIGFLSTAFFSLFSLYLLWATIKGSLKFGLRMFLVNIHPMVKNETFMNSILFNISQILITSVSVTQFCAAAFKEYATMTDIDLIFSTQIKYLKFFQFFYKYHIFEYSLFGISLISAIYFICRPSDVAAVDNLFKVETDKQRLKGEDSSRTLK